MNKKKLWITNKIDENSITKLSKDSEIPSLIAKVFLNRGIKDSNYIKDFLNPNISKLHDPFLLPDIKDAVKRILYSINNNEKILIYGDYDVDGVTSTTILYNFLKSIDVDVSYYVPDRIEEGYGLSIKALENAILKEPNLIITVDCGIVSFKEVDFLNEKKIDVIITDHHECQNNLPNALAVVNPHRPDSVYPFSDLAGVGVTFKLIHAICIEKDLGNIFLDYLDFVTIGTIADIVPLLGENRIIVSNGLKAISDTQNIGLRSLINVCGFNDKEITSYSVGFGLGPRINAAGRLGDSKRAIKLFTTENLQEAQDIAILLNEENKNRQETEAQILEKALFEIESDPQYKDEPILVVQGKNWHHGVIGIVSSRITERYYKPSIIISVDGEEAKASCRSIPEFNIFDALNHVSNLLTKYGGHKAAAGLSLLPENVLELRKAINLYAKEKLTKYDLLPKMFIDTTVLPNEINLETIKTLDLLAPFGQDNLKPIFCAHDLTIENFRAIGENGKHLKLTVEGDKKIFDCIGFNMGNKSEDLVQNEKYDFIFYPEINTWNNIDKVQFNLKDIKKSDSIYLKESFESSFKNFAKSFINSEDNEELKEIFGKITVNSTLSHFSDLMDKQNLFILNTKYSLNILINDLKNENYINYKDYICHFEKIDSNEINTPITILVNPNFSELIDIKYDNIIFMGSQFYTKDLLIFIKSNPEKLSRIIINKNHDELIKNLTINRNDIAYVYKHFTLPGHKKILINDINLCAKEIQEKYNFSINSFKLIKIFEIMNELGIINFKYNEKYNIILNINQNDNKKDLVNSTTYNIYNNLKLLNNFD